MRAGCNVEIDRDMGRERERENLFRALGKILLNHYASCMNARGKSVDRSGSTEGYAYCVHTRKYKMRKYFCLNKKNFFFKFQKLATALSRHAVHTGCENCTFTARTTRRREEERA